MTEAMSEQLLAELEGLAIGLGHRGEKSAADRVRRAADEIDRLRKDKLHWEHQNGLLEAEIERLRREKAEECAAKMQWNRMFIDATTKLEAENERLRALVQCLLDNDPNDGAADGVSVIDVWRKDARQELERK